MFKRTTTLLIGTCILSACATDSPPPAVQTAQTGIFSAVDLFTRQEEQQLVRAVSPGPVLGIFAVNYLLDFSLIDARSALAGIESIEPFIKRRDITSPDNSDTFLLLEQLGTVLEVDILDLLNRSVSRADTLNEYLAQLEIIVKAAEDRFEELDLQYDEIRDENRDARREISSMKSELQRAIRAKNFGLAGQMQEQLTTLQPKQLELESLEDQLNELRRLFEDLLEAAEEKGQAIIANREALVAGVKVTDLPGVEDLGVLDEGRRLRLDNASDIFSQ